MDPKACVMVCRSSAADWKVFEWRCDVTDDVKRLDGRTRAALIDPLSFSVLPHIYTLVCQSIKWIGSTDPILLVCFYGFLILVPFHRGW